MLQNIKLHLMCSNYGFQDIYFIYLMFFYCVYACIVSLVYYLFFCFLWMFSGDSFCCASLGAQSEVMTNK